jgi:hypothetical protein
MEKKKKCPYVLREIVPKGEDCTATEYYRTVCTRYYRRDP